MHLDAEQKKAISASGDRFGFQKALIATGGSPIVPAIEVAGGKKLDKKLIDRAENIFTLTTLKDARKVKSIYRKKQS
ncbi:MAG: hypothetical protein U5N58_06310 [Actinomycetota bacterium]|nr:hypothetical protein [Actinomycetota bacterium]